jgi:CMP-N-acetylneuraminic acid synthetase
MVKKSVIAIIPARGGSKRIPSKNVVEFMGKPLLAHTIEAALAVPSITKVVVSTDDPKIARIAHQFGAEVPFLRQEKSDDHTPVSQATLYALAQSEAHFKTTFSTVIQLMPTCPLRDSKVVRSCLTAFNKQKVPFLISCFEYGFMNPWWAAELKANGQPQKLFPQAFTTRSQDLPKLYCPSGAVWIAAAAALKQHQTFYGPGHIFHPIPWQAGVDIDSVEDLALAKALYAIR